MDAHLDCKEKKLAHYESTIQTPSYSNIIMLKNEVFQIMKELEGWCSTEKASILMDIILGTKPKIILEIGVFGGKSLIPMAFAAKFNKTGKVYGIDPWTKEASSDGLTDDHLKWWSTINHDKILKGLNSKIKQFGLEPEIELIRSTSEDCQFISNINILHIDGNHSEKASYLDVTKWVPLVESGGIIIFDDLNWSSTMLAVEWLNANCIKLAEFKSDNIWGVWIKP